MTGIKKKFNPLQYWLWWIQWFNNSWIKSLAVFQGILNVPAGLYMEAFPKVLFQLSSQSLLQAFYWWPRPFSQFNFHLSTDDFQICISSSVLKPTFPVACWISLEFCRYLIWKPSSPKNLIVMWRKIIWCSESDWYGFQPTIAHIC